MQQRSPGGRLADPASHRPDPGCSSGAREAGLRIRHLIGRIQDEIDRIQDENDRIWVKMDRIRLDMTGSGLRSDPSGLGLTESGFISTGSGNGLGKNRIRIINNSFALNI